MHKTILETIGGTPLVRLRRLIPREHATVLLKLEFNNPLSSVKDRIGLSMIEAAERTGALRSSSHIVEPTSGNTGIALAFIGAAKGYPLTLVMPDSMPERAAPYFRTCRRLVDGRVGGVFKLPGQPGAWDLYRQLLGPVDRPPHAEARGRENERCTQSEKQRPPLHAERYLSTPLYELIGMRGASSPAEFDI